MRRPFVPSPAGYGSRVEVLERTGAAGCPIEAWAFLERVRGGPSGWPATTGDVSMTHYLTSVLAGASDSGIVIARVHREEWAGRSSGHGGSTDE